MKNKTGSPVEGKDFFGREKELKFAWKHLQNGNSLVLAAPRRVGKTSFAKRLLSIAQKEDWNTLEINLEEVISEEAFVRLFIDKLEQQTWWDRFKKQSTEKLEQIITSIKPAFEYEGVKGSIEWQRKKENIYDKLKQLLDHKEDTLIMVDEVTILLNNFLEEEENGLKNASFFLNWLRSFRQITGTKIRWIFCSSIGIDNFTNIHGLSYTFNDVYDFRKLGAFTREASKVMLERLAESEKMEIPDVQIEYMMNKLGWLLPYFLQVLFAEIDFLVKVQDAPLNNATIDKAYQQLIAGKALNTWDERLKEYAALETSARAVLTHICKASLGESRQVLISYLNERINDIEKTESVIARILNMLTNDGYLLEQGGKYGFRSPLLRDFWYDRFVK